jgi:hypothetical protein
VTTKALAKNINVPSHDLTAEAALLGACFLGRAAIDAARDLPGTIDFYSPSHGHIFEAMRSLSDKGDPVEPVILHDELQRLGLADGITVGDLVALHADATTVGSARRYAEIVLNHSVRRRFLPEVAALQRMAQTGNFEDLPGVVERLGELGASASRDDGGDSWQERDLGAVIQGLLEGTVTRPVPTIGRRSDGVGLFYPARVNNLFGDSGDGKTYVAQSTACQENAAGNHVLWVDYEDDEVGTVGRLLDLGAKPEDLLLFFHYFRPDEAFTAGAREQIRRQVTELRPTLVVIDSAGESMSLDGTKPNDDDSVARWMRAMPRFIANLGPCVVYIDHTSKSRDSGALFAIGSQRKRAAVTGAAYLVELVREFGIGQEGRSKLIVAKDRCGTFVRGSKAAEFVLDATVVPYRASLEPPEQSEGREAFRPTCLMEKVSRWLEMNPGASKNALDKARLGKAEFVRRATAILVVDGLVRTERRGQSVLHYVEQSYREGDAKSSEEAF